MAARPTPMYRAAFEAKSPFGDNVVKLVPRMTVTTLDADIDDDGRGAARGILLSVLLCVPFWVGVYVMVF